MFVLTRPSQKPLSSEAPEQSPPPSKLNAILEKIGPLGAWVKRRLEKRGLLRRSDREKTPLSPRPAPVLRQQSVISAEDRVRIFEGIKDRFKNISFKDLAMKMSL